VLGTSCRAPRRGNKRRRFSSLQSVGVLRGTGAAWKGDPPGRVGEQSSISLGCTAAERTSVFVGTHHPSRGDAGVGGLSDGAPRVRAKRFIRCGHNAREVPPPVAAPARRMGCAVPGSRRGFARPNDGANLHSTGSGPRGDVSSEAPLRGSSAPFVPARGRTKAKAGRGSHLSLQNEDTKRLAVGARASSLLQKSVERLRAQRSAPPGASWSKARSNQRSA